MNRDADDLGHWRRPPLPGRFFFYPANCYAHKNHALLLDALAELRRRSGDPPAVVFTGFELPGGFALRKEIARRELDDLCHVFNEVHVDELRYVYRHALALVTPTRFEGFGMPVVEGLACGCPVICSDLPVLREVAGDHAVYFDPSDVGQLVDRMERIMTDVALRDRLAAEGPLAARRFSWDASARRMIELFREAPGRHQGPASVAGRVGASHDPRIGVLITATRGGYGVPEAIKEVWGTGYPNAAVRVDMRPDGADCDRQARSFLDQAEIQHLELQHGEMLTWERLRFFAEEERLDLVIELLAGYNHLLPSALHSLAWAWRRAPDKAVFLGEAWEVEHGRIARSARLRLLDTEDWKLEGFLYPEMLAAAPAALADWEEGGRLVQDSGKEWRWKLLLAAHGKGRLSLLRRTLAICDPSCMSVLGRYRAIKAGAKLARAWEGNGRGREWVRGLKPFLRPISRLLPSGTRSKAKRIWRHLANEP